LNLRRQSRGIYSPLPLAARSRHRGITDIPVSLGNVRGMLN